MKKIVLLLIILLSCNLYAQLLGKIGYEENYLEIMIMSYQHPNTVMVEIGAQATNATRSYLTYFEIPVNEYMAIFNSDISVKSEYDNVEYKAWGTVQTRKIVFQRTIIDDYDNIAMKDIITIDLAQKSMKIDLYRRKKIAFGGGKLKKTETIRLNGLEITEGISLYNDNRNDFIGRIVTAAGLEKAVRKTDLSSLKMACEEDCN